MTPERSRSEVHKRRFLGKSRPSFGGRGVTFRANERLGIWKESRPEISGCRWFGSRFVFRMDHSALTHLKKFQDFSSRVMRWATYVAPVTFGRKFRPGAQNVSDSLSRTYLEDIDYPSANNLELQEGLSYLSVAINDQAVQEQEDDHKDSEVCEEKKIDVIWATKVIVPKQLAKQNMLKG